MKNRPTLSQIISGTECDRNKPIFSAERLVNKIELGIKEGPNGIRKCFYRLLDSLICDISMVGRSSFYRLLDSLICDISILGKSNCYSLLKSGGVSDLWIDQGFIVYWRSHWFMIYTLWVDQTFIGRGLVAVVKECNYQLHSW